jgi:8-oxo-dGTP pyrophosphatase MutT (NUDIX family)
MHIAPNQKLIPSAVLVPIVSRGTDLNVLLMKRSHNVRHHKNEICFPGGKLSNSDEDVTTAALRETFEETGIPNSFVEVIATLPNCYTTTGYCISPIVGLISSPVNYKPCPSEVNSLFEIPLQHLLDNVVAANYITYQEHIIWGATAKIISDFKDFWLQKNLK